MKEMRWFWNLQEHLRLMWGTILQKCTSRLRCLLKYQVLSRFTLGIWFVKSLHFRLDCLTGWFFSEANFFAVEKKLNNTGICYCSFWASELIFAKLICDLLWPKLIGRMPRGEVSRNLSDRDDRMGAKIKTPKNPQGFQQNPKKYLDKHLPPPPPNPPKKTHMPNFRAFWILTALEAPKNFFYFINNIMENAIFF